ncbi:MAG: FadR family transcriptional regulator [Planctomycetes bacterium]|nr:FadR family transcriptional regulator [Planctomycetota bacterium]
MYNKPLATPFSRQSAVDACAEQLRTAILEGRLAAGERLPPERELAATFGVNRVTLRAALGRLGSAGLLATRQGSGHVVQDFRARGGPGLIAGLLRITRSSAALERAASDLFLVRRHLAHAVLERLTQLEEVDVAPLNAAVAQFGEAVARGASLEALAEADLAVVGALVDATESVVLKLCLNPVVHVLGSSAALRRAIYADPASNLRAWQLVAAWCASGRPREGLNGVLDLLRERDRHTLTHFA